MSGKNKSSSIQIYSILKKKTKKKQQAVSFVPSLSAGVYVSLSLFNNLFDFVPFSV